MNAEDKDSEQDDREMSLVEHLVELRSRVIRLLLAVAVIFVALLPFYDQVYTLFARPVLSNLLPGQSMLAKDAIDVFLTPVKVCLFLAVLVTMPWTLYQIWSFVAPGMYRHEKRLMLPILASSTILFYLGVLFAYFVILPLLFLFLGGVQLEGVAFMPDITNYMSISLRLFIAFGVVFEVPIATVILVQMGVVSIESLKAKRPYIILAAFVIGMVLTPPDIISQTLLALPLLILFEIGLFVAKRVQAKTEHEDPDV
ncbi:twin-arginine translocase subunit TatC [Suttonella sp. R2A3]|uniref:twin-arginine translocase subunit TatC n=1 Tax=Suttonella sp. R2A3 TaxID=2908648 RepID=UPI001F2E1B8F|nr:twin-arginine translocase subunit TatC [Suttonella sp. R2A3]UJF23996.1 twin-arginine translocase subunit TatC [Suttonella sp. R2A3]